MFPGWWVFPRGLLGRPWSPSGVQLRCNLKPLNEPSIVWDYWAISKPWLKYNIVYHHIAKKSENDGFLLELGIQSMFQYPPVLSLMKSGEGFHFQARFVQWQPFYCFSIYIYTLYTYIYIIHIYIYVYIYSIYMFNCDFVIYYKMTWTNLYNMIW